MGRISLIVALALATSIASSSASAQGVPVIWSRDRGAEMCADEARILQQLSRLLARGGHAISDARRVIAAVSPSDSGFVATLALEERGVHIGVRVLHADRCSTLEEQVVFVTYLLLSSPEPELDAAPDASSASAPHVEAPPETEHAAPPDTASGPDETDGSVPGESEPEPSADETESIEPEPDHAPVDPIIVREESREDAPEEPEEPLPALPYTGRIGPIVTADYVPGVWPGALVGFAWTRDRLRLGVDVAWIPHNRQRVDSVTIVKRNVVLAELRLCRVGRPRGAVTFSGCGATGISMSGATQVNSRDFDLAFQTGWYVAPVAAMTVRAYRRLNVTVEATMPVRLIRHSLSAQDELGVERVVHTDRVIAFATSVVLGFEFGKPR